VLLHSRTSVFYKTHKWGELLTWYLNRRLLGGSSPRHVREACDRLLFVCDGTKLCELPTHWQEVAVSRLFAAIWSSWGSAPIPASSRQTRPPVVLPSVDPSAPTPICCYSFLQVAPQLCSRGWVDRVRYPLLFRNSGSAGSRTRTPGSAARNSDYWTTEAVFMTWWLINKKQLQLYYTTLHCRWYKSIT
jgi:hypothetical protein